MKTLVVAAVVAVLFGLAAEGHSWDGDRKGFLLGGGLGIGHGPFADIRSQEVDIGGWVERRLTCEDTRKLMFLQDFRIGHAPDNQRQILWLTKLFWFETTSYYCYNGHEEPSDEICGIGLTGLAVAQAFDDKAPSPYMIGAAGLGILRRVPVTTWYRGFCGCIGDETELGPGLMVGLGYELSPHLIVEADLMYIAPSDVEGWNGLSVSAVIIALGY